MTSSIWAALPAALASSSITLRALMLSPKTPAWADAPTFVRVAIAVTGATFGGCAVSLLHSEQASLREVLAYSVTATSSVALLINMWRQRDRPCPRTRT